VRIINRISLALSGVLFYLLFCFVPRHHNPQRSPPKHISRRGSADWPACYRYPLCVTSYTAPGNTTRGSLTTPRRGSSKNNVRRGPNVFDVPYIRDDGRSVWIEKPKKTRATVRAKTERYGRVSHRPWKSSREFRLEKREKFSSRPRTICTTVVRLTPSGTINVRSLRKRYCARRCRVRGLRALAVIDTYVRVEMCRDPAIVFSSVRYNARRQ